MDLETQAAGEGFVNFDMPTVLAILGAVFVAIALFGGMTGNISLPTLGKLGRAAAGCLGTILLVVGVVGWAVGRDPGQVGDLSKPPVDGAASEFSSSPPPTVTPPPSPRFRWSSPAENAEVQRCGTVFAVQLLSGAVTDDMLLVLAIQRVRSTTISFKSGFSSKGSGVFSLPMNVGSAESSNNNADFVLTLLLWPQELAKSLPQPDATGFRGWAGATMPGNATELTSNRLTVHRGSAIHECG